MEVDSLIRLSNHCFEGVLRTYVGIDVIEVLLYESLNALSDGFVFEVTFCGKCVAHVGNRNRARQHNRSDMRTNASELFQGFNGAYRPRCNAQERHRLARQKESAERPAIRARSDQMNL